VLLVEDTPANQELAKALLTRRGAQVEVSSSGQDALLAVAASDFDVVLMDVHMPGMDGFTTTQKIREGGLGGNAKVPIIAVTAHALEGDRDRCIAMGMNGYLSKPYEADALIRLILKVTGSSATPAPMDGTPVRIADTRSFVKAREYVGDDEQSFQAVVAKMLELLPDVEASLKDHSDIRRIRDWVHRLKGSWSLFVDEETAKLPVTIENHLAKHGLDTMSAALLAHLENEVVALQQKLKSAIC
jgi:CheY-like chemotaxis protein